MVGDSTLEIDPGTDALPLGSSEVHLAPERSHSGSAAVLKSQLDERICFDNTLIIVIIIIDRLRLRSRHHALHFRDLLTY